MDGGQVGRKRFHRYERNVFTASHLFSLKALNHRDQSKRQGWWENEFGLSSKGDHKTSVLVSDWSLGREIKDRYLVALIFLTYFLYEVILVKFKNNINIFYKEYIGLTFDQIDNTDVIKACTYLQYRLKCFCWNKLYTNNSVHFILCQLLWNNVIM